MKITNELKRRFTKDYKVQIKVFEEPFFSERLILFHKHFNIIDNYELFLKTIENFENEDEYFTFYKQIKETVMEDIKSKLGFQNFNNMSMEEFDIDNKYKGLPSKDIYHHSNKGRKFVSIDMKKANFSSLKHFDPTIFDNKNTWEEYLSQFTDNEYIIGSKYIREVIFGNCNPKRQTSYEKYLMSILLSHLGDIVENIPIVFFSNDEIIFDITDSFTNEQEENEFLQHITTVVSAESVPFRVEKFKLKEIIDTNNNNKVLGYLRCFDDGNFDFKKVTHLYLPIILRYLYNEHINDIDLIFELEDELCKLVNIPNISIEE